MPLTRRIWISRAIFFFALALFALLVLGRSMERDLNHDEHQFLAPGALFSRHGLLPYRDYPLFHLPVLVFIYGALDWLTGQLLASAKAFSALSTIATGALIAWACFRNAVEKRIWLACAAAVVLALLFLNPLFDFTIGKTWNHEFPSFCLIAALGCMIANQHRQCWWLAAAAGFLGALASGSRLTFITIGGPLCLAPLLYPLSMRDRLRMCAIACGGFFVGMLPTLYLWAQSPERFWYDNFKFPRLRLEDPTDERARKVMTLGRKLRYLFKEILLPSLPLVAIFLGTGLPAALRYFRTRTPALLGPALVLVALVLAIAGCFAPSRPQFQHFYVLTPLLALGCALGLRTHGRSALRIMVPIAGAVALISLPVAIANKKQNFEWMERASKPDQWFHKRLAPLASSLRAQVPSGRVLTLGPTLVLEAGLDIYPEFASGPFAWRLTGLLQPPERRKSLGLVCDEDLESFLAPQPPAAILTGFEEGDLEKPFENYAGAHAYRRVELSRKFTLWVRP